MAKDEYTPDFPSEIIKEGKVQILVPKLEAYGVVPQDFAPSRAPVFYNPVMEFNRDLTVLVFRTFQRRLSREISICDPLSSQGIRGIRFAKEVEGVNRVLISDINEHAYELAKHNIALNRLQNKIEILHKDANCVLSCNSAPSQRFDVIDVDPFGTPVPFIDSALRALRNNGLLASTATDLAPLCGVHAKACLRKYSGKPLRTEYCHELAIRLLAGSTTIQAAKQDIGIHVLFSHSSEHYIRLYTQVSYGAKKADDCIKQLGFILHCFNCLHREISHQPLGNLTCPECGSKMDWAGPLWIGNIFDAAFVEQMIKENQTIAFKNSARITRLLSQTKEEASAPITYYVVDKLTGKLGVPSTSIQRFAEALKANGCIVVQTHFNSRGIRTDASSKLMQQILKNLATA